MNEIVLKPCPFCGGKAEFYVINNDASHHDNESRFIFNIRCMSCKIYSPKRYELRFELGSDGELISIIDERKNAAEAWNRRTGEQNE